MKVNQKHIEERDTVKKMITIREEEQQVLRNPNNAPTGNYFKYDIKEIEFCCDKMREKEGTNDLMLIVDRVEGEGRNRLWYCRCLYCNTLLVLSRTHLRIDIGRKSLYASISFLDYKENDN